MLTEPTLQEKYDFLCDNLETVHMDYCERDGLLALKARLYFQFDSETVPFTTDKAVILSIESSKYKSS